MEEEEGEEDECGVSWEAPSQTSAAITLSVSHSPPSDPTITVCLLFALSLCQRWLFVASSSAPLNNSNSQQGQTVDEVPVE